MLFLTTVHIPCISNYHRIFKAIVINLQQDLFNICISPTSLILCALLLLLHSAANIANWNLPIGEIFVLHWWCSYCLQWPVGWLAGWLVLLLLMLMLHHNLPAVISKIFDHSCWTFSMDGHILIHKMQETLCGYNERRLSVNLQCNTIGYVLFMFKFRWVFVYTANCWLLHLTKKWKLELW